MSLSSDEREKLIAFLTETPSLAKMRELTDEQLMVILVKGHQLEKELEGKVTRK